MKKIVKMIVSATVAVLFGLACFNQGKEAVKYKMHAYGIITCYFDKTKIACTSFPVR